MRGHGEDLGLEKKVVTSFGCQSFIDFPRQSIVKFFIAAVDLRSILILRSISLTG